jgi:hypothetical protein
VNSIINQLPDTVIADLKLMWPDIPTECGARILSKRAAIQLCGEQRVTEYIDQRIREHVSDSDVANWQFVRTLKSESSIDLVESTQKIYQRLRDYTLELEAALRRYQQWNPEDFSDIDLGCFLLNEY